MPVATASQTIGPYWHLIEHAEMADLTRFGPGEEMGERITVTGRITDGAGAPVSDAAVEIWQASPPPDDRFPGYGRCATDGEGRFRFVTLRPEPVPGLGNQTQAPHLSIVLLARGLMTALRTRLYFAGEALNETDPLLASIEDPAERATLVAQPAGPGTWTLDIRLQGEGETVFLEV
ncbi:protocatechuate 3,4-dioxygenase subunit alpha [Paracraurococcus ruber]|uniref:Protocatechuate 3,4-dioxygenase subunit alpha n=1 Tax=Paracraurococcus ruber TaxID=77675 RepID=A0ABS1CVS6_9PROT|nr:protocatechuate 3,4-dioxygenase subunit alpha [Paracraurococcus ruber]MBK1657814.1 protocatechuate 3,4-dioxygenase subunit alpha [Paracraurococcus ruber]TDG31408.1 protocatechuate 3,4-dioxygenase subunit alpha [Paracraurococcus ruber]